MKDALSMKVKILILVLLATPSIAFAWFSSGAWNEVQCEICWESIYLYSEGEITPYMPSVTSSNSGVYPPGKVADNFILISPYICGECCIKYQESFFKLISGFFNNLKIENRDNILRHKKERKVLNIKKKEEVIKKLEQELRDLKK